MPVTKHSDQILYCDRCGISFLWSKEEQDAAAQSADAQGVTLAKPKHCPGCRELLPAEDRERGIVSWFNYGKRYGFITRDEGDDLFVHRSEVPRRTRLRTGDLVEFTVQEGKRGEYAGDVVLLRREPKSPEQEPMP